MKLQLVSARFVILVSLSCLGFTVAHAGSPSPGGKGQTTRHAADALLPKAAPIMLGRAKASPTGILARLKNPGKAGVAAAAAALDKQGLKVGRNFELVPGLQRLVPKPAAGGGVRSYDQKALMAAIKGLEKSGLYEYVEPDWKVQIMQLPTDSGFTDGSLWGLRNTGQSGGTAGVDVDAVAAWSLTTGSPSVVVGVIDTGIRYTHQDLAANMWTNPGETAGNGLDDDGNGIVDDVFGINAINGSGDPMDDNDHGSHCAGTIAATAFGGGQHVGVAYNVRLMALKFLDASGSGNTSDAITCINYAVAKGADILSNSWGGGGFSQGLNDAIEAASTAGVLFVAAAGNSASDNDMTPNYPSNYDSPNVIAVAAIDRTGALAGFSSYGAFTVDVGAPGVEILSCTAQSDTSYASFQGTSMATPHVAGVAALVASHYPGIGLAEMRARVVQTAAPLSSLAGRVVSGGMVDAHAALTAVPDGNMELRVETDGSLQEGQSSPVRIAVSDLLPVTGATVTANYDGQAAVPFLDNGTAPDTQAGDGIYAAMMTTPSAVSTVNLNVQATAPGKNPASGVFTLTVTVPPPNDDFAARTVLAVGTTQTTGSNRFASRESGEPLNPSVAGGRTVWWEWTSPMAGSVTISTTGSDFDTTLAIYTGNSLAGLSLVGSNDDSSGLQSSVTFSAAAGVSYLIQVDGYGGEQGDIQLNYPAPGGATGYPFIVTQPVGRSVVVGAGFNLSVTAGGLDPLNYQWYRDGVPLDGAESATYTVAAATVTDQGFYQVEVSNTVGSVLSSAVYVAVNLVGVRPANDDFEAAVTLAGASGRVYGSNVLATGEAGEPVHAGSSAPIGSIWYSWTAPAAGQLAIDTFGSDFDTTLAAYTGSSVAALAVVAQNDDGGGGLQSSTSFSVTSGTIYHIAVDGVAAAEGLVVLNFAFTPSAGAPPNDLFANRISLGSGDAAVTGTNIGATGEPGEPNHGQASSPLASVWWSWTAPTSGNVVVSTVGSDFDTTLAVYTGSDPASLVEIASNDDSSGLTSRVSFPATAGTEYRIAVDGYGLSEGSVALTVSAGSQSSMTGTVTGPNGVTPLAGIEVTAYVPYWDDWDESWYYQNVATTTTGADGSYELAGLDAGSHRVGFRDPAGGYLTEYYNDAPDLASATEIVVGPDAVVSGINASLAEKARITGTVTGPDGVTPLAGIEVTAYGYYWDDWEESWYYASVATATTGTDGSYQLAGLDAGGYRVGFVDPSGVHLPEYYDNSPDLTSAAEVVVTASGVVGGIHASLMTVGGQQPVVSGFRMTGPGAFEMDFTGVPGRMYQLEESTDLRQWTDVGVPFLCQPGVNLMQMESTTTEKFWRVKEAP